MSRICQLCGKGYLKAKIVPRGVGNRVTKRTIKIRMPNLRSKRFILNGMKVKLIICAGCLKRVKMDSRELNQETAK
jgi:ribosomal protein L28